MKLIFSLLLFHGASASLLSSLRPDHGQYPLEHELYASGNEYPLTTIESLDPPSNGPAELSFSALLHLHRGLVSLPSITGNESGVGDYLAQALHHLNFTVEKQHLAAGRFNVYAYYEKERRAARTLVTSHIDTVPPYYPYESFANGRIAGRGSVDAKGSVAAQIGALTSLVARKEVAAADVALLFVVGEETGGDGMRAANALRLTPETVIFGEPTEHRLACGHKGHLAFTIMAEGKAAHSGYPWLGVSANELMLDALVRLRGVSLPSSDKYGNTTLNLGRIEGGVAGNVVAEKAVADVTIRLAGGDPRQVKEDIYEAVVGRLGESKGSLEIAFLGNEYGPVDIDCDVKGFDTLTVNYGTDIPNFSLKPSQKRYLYGPGSILVAHSDHEHLFASDLKEAVEGYRKLILGSL